MKHNFLIILGLFIAFLTSCGNEASINQDQASEVISDHLRNKPEFKTISFKFGQLKFHSRKDIEDLNRYKALEAEGLIRMTLTEQNKVFLSKDSTYTYQVTLAEKAAPLVINQQKEKATVIALNYVLDETGAVNFVKTGKKTAKVTVSLKKEGTAFYPFAEKEADSEFITKTYKLKLQKDSQWAID